MEEKSKEMSIKDLILAIKDWLRYFVVEWKLIVISIIAGVFIGLAYFKLSSVEYSATTTFVLEEEKGGGGLGSLAGLASIAGVDVGGGGGGIFQGENILELYKSRTMIEKTLLTPIADSSNTLLVDLYIDFNNLKEKWSDQPNIQKLDFKNAVGTSRLQDSVLGNIIEHIKSKNLVVQKPDKKLGIIKVTVNSTSENFSKLFNDKIVQNVNEFYVRTKTKKSLTSVNILQQKTDSVRSVMRGALYSVATTQDATPNLNPIRQVLRAGISTSQFSAETNKAILEELVKNLELAKISLRKETPLIQVVDKPIFPLSRTHIGLVKAIVLGAIIASLLALVYLIIKKSYHDIIAA